MIKISVALLFFFVINSKVYSQAVGSPAPDFTHNTLSHGTISLSDYRGKVVYLFFFGYGSAIHTAPGSGEQLCYSLPETGAFLLPD